MRELLRIPDKRKECYAEFFGLIEESVTAQVVLMEKMQPPMKTTEMPKSRHLPGKRGFFQDGPASEAADTKIIERFAPADPSFV
jgi:hypothetical protein